ncbi:hypothetical protein B0H19DRAFT_1272443 [Mycena capillaripes]|nr:hypothetical protein B0H19DRAFT_1272443 [Mycena capillaripes]
MVISSGSLPLNFSLHCWEPRRVGALIEATTLHSHRWQDVKFGLPRTSFCDLDLRHTFLPILRFISLDTIRESSNDTNIDTVMIQNAPALREAELCIFPIKAEMPWPQMTTITLWQKIDFTECITMLQRCRDLRNLTVRTTGPAASHTDTFTLDSLESLSCNFEVATILEYLTLPRLKRLTVTETSEVGHATILTAFVRRSGCALKYFSISIHDIPPETLLLCLRAIPTIYILPHLTALRLCGVGLSDTDFQSLSDMLRIRMQWLPPNTSLKSLTLHMDTTRMDMSSRYGRLCLPSASTMTQLRELMAAGLEVKFTITRRTGFPTRVVLDSSLT